MLQPDFHALSRLLASCCREASSVITQLALSTALPNWPTAAIVLDLPKWRYCVAFGRYVRTMCVDFIGHLEACMTDLYLNYWRERKFDSTAVPAHSVPYGSFICVGATLLAASGPTSQKLFAR